MLAYVPRSLPPAGQRRALLVALHGGGGHAPATRTGGSRSRAWNAGGGCYGKPHRDQVDDVGYITGAVRYLQQKYAVAPERTFGVGHSNGAMRMQTMVCLTDLFGEIASLAGTLMADTPVCPAARNHTIHNYHGALDQNVSIAGGSGTKGVTNIHFTSQAKAKAVFENSGGRYLLHVFPSAGHAIEHLSLSSQKQDGLTIEERLARDLRLSP